MDFSEFFGFKFDGASALAALQLILGIAATRLKAFNISKENCLNKCRELHELYVENLSNGFTDIVEKKFEKDIPIRGEPPKYPDLVAEHFKRLLKHANRSFQVDLILVEFTMLNTTIFYTAILGIIILILSIVTKIDPSILGVVAVLGIIWEIFAMVVMFNKIEKLDKFRNEL